MCSDNSLDSSLGTHPEKARCQGPAHGQQGFYPRKMGRCRGKKNEAIMFTFQLVLSLYFKMQLVLVLYKED